MRKPELSSLCRHFIVLFALVLVVGFARAQGKSQNNRNDAANRAVQSFDLDKSKANYQVVERGANHRVWKKAETIQLEDGSEEEVIHAYTELSSGLNFWDENAGRWEDSRAVIEPHRGGAVAQFGQQKIIFANNLNTLGSVEILASDGVLLKASVLGLGYFDALSGKSVILAELKNSMGELIGENQILYRDAFNGVKADVLYTYSLSGLEQDVILRENPPPPSNYGLPNLTTRLEVMTEWYDAPAPQKSSKVISRKVKDPHLRAQMAEPDFLDESLSFGELEIGQGKAFWHHQVEGEAGRFEAKVGKKWENIDGRTFLFESVEFEEVQTELEKLPPGRKKTAQLGKKNGLTFVSLENSKRHIPSRHFQEPTDSKMRRSKDGLSNDLGFVLDYTTVSGVFSDYTFEGDSTYYINGTCYFTNKLTIEGGTVVKLASGTNFSMYVQGEVECKTSAYLPAIITAKDDDKVGAFVSGSTGSPSGYYAYMPFCFQSSADATSLRHLKFRYTYYGVVFQNGEPNNACKHMTFVKVSCPFWIDSGTHVDMGNILMDDISFCGFSTYGGGTVSVENASIHDASYLVFPSSNGLTLENSLIVDVNTIYSYTNQGQSHNVELANYSDAFQTVGSAEFYLKDNSIYRDFANHSVIDADLETDFQRMTTYPPSQVYQWTSLSADTTWAPITPRDNDELDLGYHYPVIDYAAGGLQISGNDTVLAIEAGTVIAWFTSDGLLPHPYAEIKANGTPLNRVTFICYRTVQEQPVNWSHYSAFHNDLINPYTHNYGWNSDLYIEFKYCDFFDMDGFNNTVNASLGSMMLKRSRWEHCALYNGKLNILPTTGNQVFINNLFNSTPLYFVNSGPVDLEMYNNMFKSTIFNNNIHYGNCNIIDNVFDQTSIQNYQTTGLTHHHNAYINTSPTLLPLNGSDVVISGNYTWQTGPLGDYYHPPGSTLIDVGSQSAGLSGLYHMTTTTNQIAEGSSTVDIGYHYPRINGSGNLFDTDGDLILDILEDPDGDGVIDPGETDPFNSENGTTGVGGLQVFFPF